VLPKKTEPLPNYFIYPGTSALFKKVSVEGQIAMRTDRFHAERRAGGTVISDRALPGPADCDKGAASLA